MPATATALPITARIPCPRPGCSSSAVATVTMRGFTGPVPLLVCERCEHQYTLATGGSGSTSLSAAMATTGLITAAIFGPIVFSVGSVMLLDSLSGGTPEFVVLTVATSTLLTFAGTPSRFTHLVNASVVGQALVSTAPQSPYVAS